MFFWIIDLPMAVYRGWLRLAYAATESTGEHSHAALPKASGDLPLTIAMERVLRALLARNCWVGPSCLSSACGLECEDILCLPELVHRGAVFRRAKPALYALSGEGRRLLREAPRARAYSSDVAATAAIAALTGLVKAFGGVHD